ncbi:MULTISPECIES: amino acid permease [Corynebacterium]|uniref:amino acid permease n=1 Tax=Corynebacterium TaxID=1716 RepID=UPI0015A225AD|nr:MULTISPECIES: amino acid permease [Corynebacterium]MCQ4607075.1 amino acid permease [Corynebacterium pseudogenitalium]MCQ4611991.1 amino acid permease [Corynebacterium sp. CCUG 51687]MDK8244525.1 amino acid permease [Corynebacterium sp. UMB10321]UUA88130.1 amino acid permease [Corynebacterium pseudogenitalium]WPJ92730.1 amino acid permease [Corynebacterium sp. UMB2355A]
MTSRSSKPKGLTHRHIHFIALGSAIGTGLFYGSAGAIQAAGPSVLLVYLLGGAVVYFMLRALGEMSVQHPVRGSFAVYTREHLGGLGGYITGWMFAFEMMIVCLADLTAIGIYMKFWFPDTPAWVWITTTLLVIGAANLASVRWFGELEFAFTLIKVVAVMAMIVGGAAILAFGLGTDPETTGISNLWNDGGFFPNGIEGMIAAFILVLFAFGGTEIIGVAGTEADDPDRSIPKAVNTVPLRILLFYVLAILVILMLNPWRAMTGEESPFVQIFDTLGVNWAAALLNLVVITAALSAINADLFGTGRVLTGLAKEGLAPKIMKRTIRDIPVMTTITLLLVLIIGVVLNALYPNIFETIAALATFATVFVWLMILLAHVASRRNMSAAERETLSFPVPFWPYGQWFAIIFILFTFGIMVWLPQYHMALAVGVAFVVIMTVLYFVTGRPKAVAAAHVTYEMK